MTDAVVLRDVFRVFSTPEGDAAALQGLSLGIGNGELVAVLGPSGSGKTTLLRLLAGLDRPSAGSVRAFERDLAKLPSRRLAEYRTRTLGYADQHYSLMLASELTAHDLVTTPLALRGEGRPARDRRADELLERVGLLDRRDAHPTELSGGEQQRIAVCAALAHNPRLFLADEPTGELDAENALRLFELIGELVRSEKTTTVLVSHDPAAAAVADRVVTIRDGRVAAEAVREHEESGDTIVVGRGGWLHLPEEVPTPGRHRHAREGASRARRDVVRLRPCGKGARHVPGEPGKCRENARSWRSSDMSKAVGRGSSSTASMRPSVAARSTPSPALRFRQDDAPPPRRARAPLEGGRGRRRLRRLEPGPRRARRAPRGHHRLRRPGAGADAVPQRAPRTSSSAEALHGTRGNGAHEALADVGLSERASQRVARLSTGERGRVAIARALAARCRLILVDEPTSRLDQTNALSIAVLLARLAPETGIAVVCATHGPLLIEQADAEHLG